MKVIKEHDIIKVNNELLHILKISNNGSYLCKNSKGRLVWADYTQKPVYIMHSRFYGGFKLIKEIKKPTSRQMGEAIITGDFSTVDGIKAAAKKDARKVFDAVSSGAVSLIWYDLPPVRCQSGTVSFMRYALHRSPKKADHLQLSCMEIKNRSIIPTSDRQYNITDGGFSEFFRDLPAITNINYLEQ